MMGLVLWREEESEINRHWRNGHGSPQPEGGFCSPGSESAGTLILDFPVSVAVRNKNLLLKPPFYGILL